MNDEEIIYNLLEDIEAGVNPVLAAAKQIDSENAAEMAEFFAFALRAKRRFLPYLPQKRKKKADTILEGKLQDLKAKAYVASELA